MPHDTNLLDFACWAHMISLILKDTKGCKFGDKPSDLFFLPPYFSTFNLLLNPFLGKPQLSELISPTHQFMFLQCCSLLQKEISFKTNYNRSSFKPCYAELHWPIQMFSFYFSLLSAKNYSKTQSQKSDFKRMRFSLSAHHLLSSPLCFHQFCPLVHLFDVWLYNTYKSRKECLCSQK